MSSGTPGVGYMHPERETTSYAFEIPADDWEAWKETLPKDVRLYERLHELIRADSDANNPIAGVELATSLSDGSTIAIDSGKGTVSLQCDVKKQLWKTWSDAIPQSISLHDRLHQLIRADTLPEDAMDDADVSLVLLKFERVAQRVENAETALDEGDEERARDELAAIREIADPDF